MNITDILAALNSASSAEREQFAKALGAQTSGGLTRAELDAHLESFAKGGNTGVDLNGATQAAQLDVTGWIQSITDGIKSALEGNKAELQEMRKSITTIGQAVSVQFGAVEEMRKSFDAPRVGQGSAVVRQGAAATGASFAKGGFGQAGNGGMVENGVENGGKFAELTEAQVVSYLRREMENPANEMRKGQIAHAISLVELDYAIDGEFFDRLGLTGPA